MDVLLERVSSNEHGTFGVLVIDGVPACVTLEDPWKDNKNNISCIPDGTYTVKKFSGKRYKNVWEVQKVKGRSAILIHQGNTQADTEGCILVGKEYGFVNGTHGIIRSMDALNDLRKKLPDEFTLTIRG